MQSRPGEPIEPWLDLQYARAGVAMLRSISPIGIVKTRPGFGQTIRPLRGSIVASPVLAGYDPDPDYFFHWFRDSAVVLDALRLLHQRDQLGAQALTHLHDFVDFSLSLGALDGRRLISSPAWRTAVAPDYVKFLRTDADLAAVHGDAVAGETRVNPDASLDISSWARPQYDGPALRALTLLRWLRLDAVARAPQSRLPLLLRCGPGVHSPALARAVVRHLGRGEGAALLHDVRVGSGTRRRGGMAANAGSTGALTALCRRGARHTLGAR